MPGGKPFQSKLTPHYELIARLRKKHTPYPEIAKRLHEEHGLKVSASTIFEFVKVRARRAGVFTLPEVPAAAAPTTTAAIEPQAAPSQDQPPKVQTVDTDAATPTAATPAPAAGKKYVFIPKPKAPNRFSEEDLQWNDPLA